MTAVYLVLVGLLVGFLFYWLEGDDGSCWVDLDGDDE